MIGAVARVRNVWLGAYTSFSSSKVLSMSTRPSSAPAMKEPRTITVTIGQPTFPLHPTARSIIRISCNKPSYRKRQLEGETYAMALRTSTLGPTFRAENSPRSAPIFG